MSGPGPARRPHPRVGALSNQEGCLREVSCRSAAIGSGPYVEKIGVRPMGLCWVAYLPNTATRVESDDYDVDDLPAVELAGDADPPPAAAQGIVRVLRLIAVVSPAPG